MDILQDNDGCCYNIMQISCTRSGHIRWNSTPFSTTKTIQFYELLLIELLQPTIVCIIGASISGSNHNIAWIASVARPIGHRARQRLPCCISSTVSCTRCAYVEIQRLLVPVPTYQRFLSDQDQDQDFITFSPREIIQCITWQDLQELWSQGPREESILLGLQTILDHHRRILFPDL